MVQIALLGPLEVELSGRRVKVPSGKPSELLVRLALDAGEVVRADRLIDELWAAGALSTRRNTLQSKVAMLRRALGDPDRDREQRRRLRPRRRAVRGGCARGDGPGGYGVPAARCRRRPRRCRPLCLDAGSCSAGRCFRPPATATGSIPHQARLDEARTKLLEIWFSARLRLGDVGDVIGELEAAVAAHTLPGEPLGAADHRAVPSRASGRCPGDLPAGPEPAGRRARSRPWTATAAARAVDPGSGPESWALRSAGSECAGHSGGQPAVDVCRPCRSRRRGG